MKVGDLIRFQNLHSDWGQIGWVYKIYRTDYGTGQIYLISNGCSRSLPWLDRHKYIKEVISESR